MDITTTTVRSILTRASGFLRGVATHSLQPYRGCSYGNSLCGVGCYVQHIPYVVAGRRWGSFLEVRQNAADVYREQYEVERRWAHKREQQFGVFCSSATDPFVPQERTFRITRSILEAMIERPPDVFILQTHSHLVLDEMEAIRRLRERTNLRVHISIETDRERIEDLPPHASPIEQRFSAVRALREAAIPVIVTVAPLLPIADPAGFFGRIADSADAAVIDHFIGGDGTASGSRTERTPLPAAMERLHPGSASFGYREEIVQIARRIMPGRVGVGAAGFAGRFE